MISPKTYIISLLMGWGISLAQAQVAFKGVVKDSVNQPIEMASVVLLDKESNAMETYGITNAEGRFELQISSSKTYKIQVSAFGLRTLNEELIVLKEPVEKNFVLRNDIVLDEVVVKLPVTVSGDTIIYNADSFKNGTERKLEDILDNLPGVEINENNQIEVEGKVVNKLLVNGKEFFEGDTKIGTKNIPSSAVDKIQVLRNYSNVNQLSSVRNNQDNFAINIKLKQGKENFLFGNIKGGYGDSEKESLYLAQPKLFFYNPKYSINFIGDLNNIGEIAISRRDLQGFSSGTRTSENRSGTNINLGNNDISFNTNQNNAQRIENKLGSLNFSYSPTKQFDISGFFIYNYSLVNALEQREIQYTNSSLLIPDENTDEASVEESNQALTRLSLSYKPNYNHQLDYKFFGRLSENSQELNTLSSIIGRTTEKETITPAILNQELNYYFTLDENNIIAAEIQQLYKKENPFYNLLIDANGSQGSAFDTTAAALGFFTDLEQFDIGQNQLITSQQLDAKLDYYHIINNKSNLNVTLGGIYSRQDLETDLFQRIGNDQIAAAATTSAFEFNNTTAYQFYDYYLSAHLRFKSGIFTVTPGFSLRNYTTLNTQSGIDYKTNFIKVLPDFETRIQFKKSESLTFNYNIINQFTDITRLSRGLRINSYNSFQYGTPELENALAHNLSLLYRSFNLFNYTNVFIRAAYTSNLDQIRSVTSFENVIRTSSFFNSNFNDENFNVFGRIEKTYGKIKVNLNSAINYSKIYQFIQEVPSLNKGVTRSLTPGIRTSFRYAPNLRINLNHSLTSNNQGARKTQFERNSLTTSFDALIKDKLTFKSDFSYIKQINNNQNVQYFKNLNASIFYKRDKDSKWEYELNGSNLLDVASQIRNNATNISVFSFETFIQPRYVSLRMIYNL
jgi:hypothetical protein